jgi:hypothetical protein
MTTETNRLEQLITLLEETRDDHDKFFTLETMLQERVFARQCRK